MENVILKNDRLSVRINFKGAEISSIYNYETNTEHIWQANKDVWARHAPVLFPIVGQVKDSKYKAGNKTYSLSQHGFARDRIFSLDEITADKAVFKLESDDDSLKIYPYTFELYIIYTLAANKLTVEYLVKNKGYGSMYFSIGAHPGFTVPFNSNESFEDYKLVFSSQETLNKLLLNETGLLSNNAEPNYLNNEREIALSYDLFSRDALIFENTKSEYIDILNSKNGQRLRVSIKDFPYLGIWTKPNAHAPFLCIEPWYGITDSENSTGDLESKKGIQKLNEAESFKASYYIQID